MGFVPLLGGLVILFSVLPAGMAKELTLTELRDTHKLTHGFQV